MIVRSITCPICGNDTHVNNMRDAQKCEFCRRPLNVKFEKKTKATGKNKWAVTVEPVEEDFGNKRPGGYRRKEEKR